MCCAVLPLRWDAPPRTRLARGPVLVHSASLLNCEERRLRCRVVYTRKKFGENSHAELDPPLPSTPPRSVARPRTAPRPQRRSRVHIFSEVVYQHECTRNYCTGPVYQSLTIAERHAAGIANVGVVNSAPCAPARTARSHHADVQARWRSTVSRALGGAARRSPTPRPQKVSETRGTADASTCDHATRSDAREAAQRGVSAGGVCWRGNSPRARARC